MRKSLRALSVAAGVALLSTPLYADLVGYWPLNGDYNDASGQGNNGTAFGAPAFSSAAPAVLGGGQSILLDGASAVDLGNPDILNFTNNDWTISAWLNTTAHNPSGSVTDAEKGTIFSKGGDGGNGFRYAVILTESKKGVPTIIVDDNKTAPGSAFDKRTLDGASNLTGGDWHNVVAARQGGRLLLYVDGVLESARNIEAGYDLTGVAQHNAYIGTVFNHNGAELPGAEPNGNVPYMYKFFKGNIDDVAVYNHRIEGNQVQFLATGGSPLSLPAAVAGSDVRPALPGPFGAAASPTVIASQDFSGNPGQLAYTATGQGVSSDKKNYWTLSNTAGLLPQRTLDPLFENETTYWTGSKANDTSFGPQPKVLTFDPVSVAGYSDLVLQLDLAAPNSNEWESADYFKIYVNDVLLASYSAQVAGGPGNNLCNVADVTDVILPRFTTHGFELPEGLTDVVIKFQFLSSGSDENIGIDNIRLTAVVPEPGTLSLLGLGAISLLSRRRRA